MEQQLLGASLRSRHDYTLVKNYIDLKLSMYSKPFQVLMGMVGDYYARDADAEFVIPEVLMAQVTEVLRNEKHVKIFSDLVAESAAIGSDTNVRHAILAAKQQEVGDRLAVAITSPSPGDNVDDLMREYNELRNMTSLEDMSQGGLTVYNNINLADLMTKEFDPANLIKIAPVSLNDKLDGGAKRGHHLTVFGRPESMKSGTVINMNCGIAKQNLKSLYFINEDPAGSIIMRHVSNLSGMTKHQIQENPRKAEQLAYDRGFGNITVVDAKPGTPGQLEDCIDKYQPDVIIVDQLRNLKVKADNRVNQLEYAATAIRNLGKECNVLAISVTQAGDSADGKEVLEMGDVDFSNTGIPAQADVMIGIGVSDKLEAEGLRVISLPKNKISGEHSSFPVRVIPQLSRLKSV